MPNSRKGARAEGRRTARARKRKIGKVLAGIRRRQQRWDREFQLHANRIRRLSPARRAILLARAQARKDETPPEGATAAEAAEEALD